MKISSFLGLALALLCLIYLVSSVDAQEVSQNSPVAAQTRTTLFEHLQELGNKFDCFFTIEESWSGSVCHDNFALRYIEEFPGKFTRLESVSNAEMALKELQQDYPHFSYLIDPNMPQIIHIIDTRLNQQPQYPMNNILPSIDFHGRVTKLIKKIGIQENQIKPQNTFAIGEFPFPDNSSIVKVQGTSLTIREALSNFVELKDRPGRLLWVARTELGEGKITYIHYVNYPPKPKAIN